MVSSPYRNRDRDLERKLEKLERKYDKGGAPQREYARACADIRELLREEKIDRDHADLLHDEAKAVLDGHMAKAAAKRRKEQDVHFQQAVGPLVFLIFLAMVIIIVVVIAFS